jgi:hypothetical protein
MAASRSGLQIGTESAAHPARPARLRPRGSRYRRLPFEPRNREPTDAAAKKDPEGRAVSRSKGALRAGQRVAALGTMLATLGGCHFEVPPTGPKMEHPNGLRLTLPQGYRATPTPQGFVVEPQDGNSSRRFPVTVGVTWYPGPPPEAHKYKYLALRMLAFGRVLYYWSRVDEGGGSGGDEYELRACERVGTGSVCLSQFRLSESGTWTFELWRIARGVSFQAPPSAPAR